MQKRFSTEKLLTVICIVWGLFHLYTAFFGVLTAMWQRSIHLGFAMVVCFLMMFQKTDKKLLKALYIAMCLAAIGFVLYFLLDFKGIVSRYGRPNDIDLLFGGAIIILTLIFTAEKTGKILPGIAIVFILYAIFGQSLPGILGHRGYSVTRIINQMSLSTEGIFGTSLGVSATYIYVFMLFGALLTKTNIGQFYIDFALKALGKSPGGPAKAAIVSSCLFGSVSGSAVANVAGTGVVTIPLMKETGYKPEFAGAVEAAASTGGQLMPPIMGAAAFLMAESLGLPYITIVKAAVIPAILYFTGIFITVHLEAHKLGLKGLPREQLPKFLPLFLRKGYMLIPLVVIVTFLCMGKTAVYAAIMGIVSCLLIGLVTSFVDLAHGRKPTFGFNDLLEVMCSAARNIISVAIACAMAGIIIGIVTLTGIGLKFGAGLISISHGIAFITLFLTMISSIILGMGAPTTANYLITSTITAGAIIGLGFEPLAAHMFAFYFGIIADITPPVALAAIAGAAIAKAKPMKTAFNATKLAIGAFIIPYIFVFNPQMLMIGTTVSGVIGICVTALVGMFGFSVALEGYAFRKVSVVERILFAAAGLMCVVPETYSDVIGLSIIAVLIAWQLVRNRIERKAATAK